MDPFVQSCNLYLQGAPVKTVLDTVLSCPHWSEESFQDCVVNKMINHPLIVKNGRVFDYERQFIRGYFDKLMEKDAYIADSFAAEYARVHLKHEEEGEYHFRYYALPNTDEFIQVRLKRSSNCTAFQTWEACFALLEWVLTHSSAFKDSTILEVGSGSGLCGQMLQCIVENCSVVMSDYCNEVTEYILSNVEENRDVFARLHKPMPAVETIDFCNFDKNQIQRIHPDVLVATDVTFSPDLIDGLIELITYSLTQCGLRRAFICCTVRTKELFDRFKEGLEAKGLAVTEHVLEQQNVWYYMKYAEIVLLEVSLCLVC